jgi:hypothetical protein
MPLNIQWGYIRRRKCLGVQENGLKDITMAADVMGMVRSQKAFVTETTSVRGRREREHCNKLTREGEVSQK